jgi:hypothetical protein
MSALSLPACRVLDGSNFGGGPVTFSWDTNSAWCATAAPRNAGFCFGDSGGPLITRGKSAGEDVHVGLASWSRKPCGNTFPCERGGRGGRVGLLLRSTHRSGRGQWSFFVFVWGE